MGNNITSEVRGGSVLADDRSDPKIAKERSLLLDFESGTYLNLPQWTGSSTTASHPGQMMFSGDNMYLWNGNAWRVLQTSAI